MSTRKNKKKIQVEFAPGALDSFDGTQEELDDLIEEIKRMAESGELEENSVSLDDAAWDQLTDEEKDIISASLEDLEKPRRLH